MLLTALLIGLTLALVAVQKTYALVPAHELKRRAQKGDKQAQVLYRAAAFGLSLKVLMWLLIGLSASALFFVVARTFVWPVALVGILLILWLGVAWLPNSRVTSGSKQLAVWLTPMLAWVLNYLHPALEWLGLQLRHVSRPVSHTKLYEKDDILELLQSQAKQTDNRVAKAELDMAGHALTFGAKPVRDTLTPYSQVTSVNLSDSLGPQLMDELHKSGHSRFPVYDSKKDNVVGMLYLRDLLQEQQGGKVKDIYKKQVSYVHEEQTLYQTLQAFLKTKRHLFVVVNRFEEVVGIITIEDVIEQIIGQPIMDEFDQYEDLRAVAALTADKIHKQQKHETPEPAPAAKKPAQDEPSKAQ